MLQKKISKPAFSLSFSALRSLKKDENLMFLGDLPSDGSNRRAMCYDFSKYISEENGLPESGF